jgi:hypothetical protein
LEEYTDNLSSFLSRQFGHLLELGQILEKEYTSLFFINVPMRQQIIIPCINNELQIFLEIYGLKVSCI